MRALRRLAPILALVLAVALAPAACGSAPAEGRGTGTVQAVDPAARKLTLDHGDIPGLMKAMTMTFQVAPDVPLDGFAPGTRVDFRVKEEGGVYPVTELRRSGS